jgi:4'-phosphopantetheinyl transferase
VSQGQTWSLPSPRASGRPAGVHVVDTEALAPTVRVWAAALGSVEADFSALLDLLDDNENAVAARRPDHKRPSYVLAHALRRLLLAECLPAEPGELVFTARRGGCPEPISLGGDRWYHSLSHSGPFVAVAAARDRPLGVDIEGPRSIRNANTLAAALLPSGTDGAGGVAATDAEILAAWVRWEALAKATGEGMLRRLHPVPDRLWANGNRWRVHSLSHDLRRDLHVDQHRDVHCDLPDLHQDRGTDIRYGRAHLALALAD